MGVKRETLNGGNVLRALVAQFNADRTEQNAIALLRCLRDSFVWIPCNVEMSGADSEMFRGAKVGDIVMTNDDIRLVPDILKNGDYLFFPVFSSCEQMGEEYGHQFSKVEKHFFEAMSMAIAHEETAGIVLDAFTQPYVLVKELFEFVGSLPTNVDDDK